MNARIRHITYHLPQAVSTAEDLVREMNNGWSAEKIVRKTGIRARRIAAPGECASDLACAAARALFAEGACSAQEIDFLLLCTQSPDYLLPTTACLLQDRLGLPTTAGALDFNLGCSGFVYGLGMAKGLLLTGQASKVLLLTADTYSRHVHPGDKSVRTLFGDGAAATLIEATGIGPDNGSDEAPGSIGQMIYGTNGAGYKNLMIASGGARLPRCAETAQECTDKFGNTRSQDHLFMDGPEIFKFTMQVVPGCVDETLARNGLAMNDVDLFVFHQANAYMLEGLRQKIGIPEERFYVNMADCGNTVSATIPIALRRAVDDGSLEPGMRVMLVGYGVGYSWAGTVLQWA